MRDMCFDQCLRNKSSNSNCDEIAGNFFRSTEERASKLGIERASLPRSATGRRSASLSPADDGSSLSDYFTKKYQVVFRAAVSAILMRYSKDDIGIATSVEGFLLGN